MLIRMKNRISNQEILTAINDFASATEVRFQSIDSRFQSIESRMATKDDLADLRTEFKRDIQTAKLDMIDHVDRKVDQVRGDITAFIRRGYQPLAS